MEGGRFETLAGMTQGALAWDSRRFRRPPQIGMEGGRLETPAGMTQGALAWDSRRFR